MASERVTLQTIEKMWGMGWEGDLDAMREGRFLAEDGTDYDRNK